MNKLPFIIFILSQIVLLQACGGVGKAAGYEEVPQSSSIVGGNIPQATLQSIASSKWVHSCDLDTPTQMYFRQEFEFYVLGGSVHFKNSLRYFDDSACVQPFDEDIFDRTLTDQSTATTIEVQGQLYSQTVTLFSSARVTEYNSSGVCGKTDWVAGTPVNAIGTPCEGDATSKMQFFVSENIMKIQRNGIFTNSEFTRVY